MTFRKRSRGEGIQLLALLPVLLIPFFLPADPQSKASKTAAFDQKQFDRAISRRPDVVLIGNSMLNTRVDRAFFDELIQPNRAAYVTEGGTRSAAWYFGLKNFAGPIRPSPKLAIIFYRDFDFARPGKDLEGERLQTARTFMRPEDEETLDEIRKMEGSPPESPLDFYLPDVATARARHRISEWALDVASAGAVKDYDEILQKKLNQLFDFANLRANVFDAGALDNDMADREDPVFSASPARNLLVRYADFAHEKGIRICFYRVKRRPDAQNRVTQTPALRAYTAAFRAWAEANGCEVMDETDDPRLLLSMYHDGDHLGKAAMKDYTRIFFERVRSLLPQQTANQL